MNWTYEKTSPNLGVSGDAFRQVFNGNGIDQAEQLAREAIQNSVDASSGDKPVEVVFRKERFDGADRAAFAETIDLEAIRRRAEALELPADCVLSNDRDPIDVLYVEDRGTTGLSGDPLGPRSKLRKLLMEVGGSEKVGEASSGGSYGFGKAVYAGSSRIATVFAYSRSTDDDGKAMSVLMGCSYHRSYEIDMQGR
jgi:hypothetical protein